MTVELAAKLLNLPSVRVLVVGDAITDVDLHGRYERFAQEYPAVPVFKVERREERPGGAGAVAAMATALGGTVSLLAATTAVKTRRWVDGVMVGRDDSDGLDFTPPTPDVIRDLVDRADVVLVADYGKGFCSQNVLSTVFDTERGVPVIVDPAMGRSWWDYRGATAIKCNELERDDVGWTVEEVNSRFKTVVTTHGNWGMKLQQGSKGTDVLAKPRRSVDVTGCGDMVLACLGVFVGGGMSWEDACRAANAAAGLKVERRGAVPVHKGEVLEDLCDGVKVLPVDLLAGIAGGRRKRGLNVAFTNGCFDVLHAGHIRYLREARAQADYLVVGLNSDESVRALKGYGRPIQPLTARSGALSGLQAVDYIVSFDDATPIRLVERLKPDVLVKGGDYDRSHIVGADLVESWGGRTHIVPLVNGLSTTRIVEKIRETPYAYIYIR